MTKIIIPRNTFWCSNLPALNQNFLIFFIEKKGIVLANKVDCIEDLSKVDNNYFELPSGLSIYGYLDMLSPENLDSLLKESIFVPFTEESKFWDEMPEGLSIVGEQMLDCIPRIQDFGGKPINGNWETPVSRFFENWPNHIGKSSKIHPNPGVNLFTKQNHVLAFERVIDPENFLEFIQKAVPERDPHPKQASA